jgi:hypothetical protein
MIRNFLSRFSILAVCSLMACNLPVTRSAPTEMSAADVMMTVASDLTQIALGTASPPPTGGDATKTIEASPNPILEPGTASLTPGSKPGSTVTLTPSQPKIPCDQAAAGRPIDVTIPDETPLKPNQVFSKTWRLVNSGSCSWTAEYAVVWFSGVEMGVNREQFFLGRINPGQSVDVTVDMLTPTQGGIYQSNWKLRNPSGKLFGLGPNGDAPFWARIEVVPETTTTPIFIPTLTQTVAVFSNATIRLALDDSLDLETGYVNSGVKDDIKFENNADSQPELSPINNARLTLVGTQPPQSETCLAASLTAGPVILSEVPDGTYFCYRTGQDRLGFARLVIGNLTEKELTLEYTTWNAP